MSIELEREDVDVTDEPMEDNEELDDLIEDLETVLNGASFTDTMAALGIIQSNAMSGFLEFYAGEPNFTEVAEAVVEYADIVIAEMTDLKNQAQSKTAVKH
jgi:hypothetical protein